MNGYFTSVESRYLTPNERAHYLELGLCAPVDVADLDRISVSGTVNAQIEDLRDELSDLNDEHHETVDDLEDLQLKVKLCLAYLDGMDGASLACDIKAQIQSFLS